MGKPYDQPEFKIGEEITDGVDAIVVSERFRDDDDQWVYTDHITDLYENEGLWIVEEQQW